MPTIVYDDSIGQLKNVALSLHELFKKIALDSFYIMPWKYNGSTLPYSKIKSSLAMFFKEKKHVVIVSLPNSTLFKEAVKEQRFIYVNYCSNGFKFLNLCYTSKNASIFFVTPARYGGTLGFYIGNNVNTMMRNVKLLLVEPYSRGGLHVNNSFYTLFPSEIFT